MATPRLIVGLGNPTAEHENDRHNAGFWFVDALAKHHGASLKREAKFFGNTGRLRIGSADIHLLQPMTYMNRSGQAVAALARFYRIEADEILVAYDELDLSPGTARFKLGGSSTHNGAGLPCRQTGGGFRTGPPIARTQAADRRGDRAGHRRNGAGRQGRLAGGDEATPHRGRHRLSAAPLALKEGSLTPGGRMRVLKQRTRRFLSCP
jgi:hypothetical protein